jgi:hypothetical protein
MYERLYCPLRLALNARAKVRAGNLVQTGQVLSGGSYISQNDLRVHFGLGNLERVDSVYQSESNIAVLRGSN